MQLDCEPLLLVDDRLHDAPPLLLALRDIVTHADPVGAPADVDPAERELGGHFLAIGPVHDEPMAQAVPGPVARAQLRDQVGQPGVETPVHQVRQVPPREFSRLRTQQRLQHAVGHDDALLVVQRDHGLAEPVEHGRLQRLAFQGPLHLVVVEDDADHVRGPPGLVAAYEPLPREPAIAAIRHAPSQRGVPVGPAFQALDDRGMRGRQVVGMHEGQQVCRPREPLDGLAQHAPRCMQPLHAVAGDVPLRERLVVRFAHVQHAFAPQRGIDLRAPVVGHVDGREHEATHASAGRVQLRRLCQHDDPEMPSFPAGAPDQRTKRLPGRDSLTRGAPPGLLVLGVQRREHLADVQPLRADAVGAAVLARVGLDATAVDIPLPGDDRGRLGGHAHALLAALERLLGCLLRGDVDEHTVQRHGLPGRIVHDAREVTDPDDVPVRTHGTVDHLVVAAARHIGQARRDDPVAVPRIDHPHEEVRRQPDVAVVAEELLVTTRDVGHAQVGQARLPGDGMAAVEQRLEAPAALRLLETRGRESGQCFDVPDGGARHAAEQQHDAQQPGIVPDHRDRRQRFALRKPWPGRAQRHGDTAAATRAADRTDQRRRLHGHRRGMPPVVVQTVAGGDVKHAGFDPDHDDAGASGDEACRLGHDHPGILGHGTSPRVTATRRVHASSIASAAARRLTRTTTRVPPWGRRSQLAVPPIIRAR